MDLIANAGADAVTAEVQGLVVVVAAVVGAAVLVVALVWGARVALAAYAAVASTKAYGHKFFVDDDSGRRHKAGSFGYARTMASKRGFSGSSRDIKRASRKLNR